MHPWGAGRMASVGKEPALSAVRWRAPLHRAAVEAQRSYIQPARGLRLGCGAWGAAVVNQVQERPRSAGDAGLASRLQERAVWVVSAVRAQRRSPSS
jgi:hypothetical protein